MKLENIKQNMFLQHEPSSAARAISAFMEQLEVGPT